MTNTNIVILGAGGHAKVLLDCLSLNKNVTVNSIFDINPELIGRTVSGIHVVGSEDEILENYPSSSNQLVNGIGSIGVTKLREEIFKKFKQAGYTFFNVIHPNAYLSNGSDIGESVQLMSGCTIQPGCTIGDNIIVNTHTVIDHDCHIGDHVHLAPGVTCCGNVTIGSGTHVGCGAVILQGVKIGERCVIAAGAVVVRDVMSKTKVVGVPARNME